MSRPGTGSTPTRAPTWLFSKNTVLRCSRGIFVTSSVSRADNIQVVNNQVLSPFPVAFNLEAITTSSTDNVTISGNTLSGWSGNTIEDYGNDSTGLVVSNNSISQ